MKIRPYLTFNGQCNDAIALYTEAFRTEVLQILRFGEMPPTPGFALPDEYKNRVLQCTMKFGDDFIRLSDCGPGHALNEAETERISLAIETDVDAVKHAFTILAMDGEIGIPLAETFYSPCAGVVFDKFGVMWNFVGQK